MICEQKEIQSLDFFISFFVKEKRKENKTIAQIEFNVKVMVLLRIIIINKINPNHRLPLYPHQSKRDV